MDAVRGTFASRECLQGRGSSRRSLVTRSAYALPSVEKISAFARGSAAGCELEHLESALAMQALRPEFVPVSVEVEQCGGRVREDALGVHRVEVDRAVDLEDVAGSALVAGDVYAGEVEPE